MKLQSLGPRLVWTTYVPRPGERLALSRMVMYRDATPVAPSEVPGAPPRPQGGSESGSQTVPVTRIEDGSQYRDTISITLHADPSKRFSPPILDAISDAAPEKDAVPPSVVGPIEEIPGANVVTYVLSIHAGSATTVIVSYTRHYEPSEAALLEWNQQVASARATYEASRAEEELERSKRLIREKSRIRTRPANDLREEERYELMNRLISEAFHGADASAVPGPLEIELFHSYFDVSALFYYVHPAWWKPRYGLSRSDYEITDESEPARFGKSLGWVLQLDGDRRRNEFLNSPWVRICVPVRPNMEERAVMWLGAHVEGERGFATGPNTSLGQLLGELRARRAAERLAQPGPNYVTYDGTVAPGRESASDTYPVVDEFEVVVPTEGFVYEGLTVALCARTRTKLSLDRSYVGRRASRAPSG